MKTVELYTKKTCGYCQAAKRLLAEKGISYSEVELLTNPKRRAEMIDRARGRTTVPQIFIGGTHVGGYDDLAELEQAGKLDAMLAA